jgi:hypothetical protein
MKDGRRPHDPIQPVEPETASPGAMTAALTLAAPRCRVYGVIRLKGLVGRAVMRSMPAGHWQVGLAPSSASGRH